MKNNLAVLYTELAGYTVASLNAFALGYPEIEIHVFHWKVNNEAPFHFENKGPVRFHDRSKLDITGLQKEVHNLDPSAILCSGWMDKDYLAVVRAFSGKVPTVLIMDNKWTGSARQRLASFTSRFSFIRHFSHAWVSGNSQKQFALKLGFSPDRIRTGFYSADLDAFSAIGRVQLALKKEKFPHRFIYAGRYYDFKGVREMWKAFIKLKGETGTDWEFWCLGTGDIEPMVADGIKHFGFVQPADLGSVMKDAGVFILPSIVEPWGVVVQEFAAAGFPLLLSDKVGAAESFLEEGRNGFGFPAGSSDAIMQVMKKVIAMKDEELQRLGERSHELAQRITPSTWTATLHEFIQKQRT
jgi:glycosyltransferase involved in cell wall biosynthesis